MREGIEQQHTNISIVRDAWIRSFVSTRETDQVSRLGTSPTSDLELMATRVELCSGVRRRRVQGDDLMTDEIEACRDALRDGVCEEAASFQNRVGGPFVGCALTTLLLNLKPHSATGK